MNVRPVCPAALIAAPTGPGRGSGEGPRRGLRARVGEEVRYHLAPRELRRHEGGGAKDQYSSASVTVSTRRVTSGSTGSGESYLACLS
jgi:hypothetical protein